MGSIINKFREKFDNYKKLNNKKIIEYIIIAAVLGIIIIFTANGLWSGENSTSKRILYTPEQSVEKEADNLNFRLEQKLAQILSEVQGVGRVSVLVTYLSGPEAVHEKDIKENHTDTNEKDSGGGERRVSETEKEDKLVFIEGQNGVKNPVVLKQVASKVMGIIVVADGAEDIVVKKNIIRAVEAAAGISGHKIQVFKRR